MMKKSYKGLCKEKQGPPGMEEGVHIRTIAHPATVN